MKKQVLTLDQTLAGLALIVGFSLIALSVGRGHYGVTLPAIVMLSSSVYLIFRKNLTREIVLSSLSERKTSEYINHFIYLVSLSASFWLLWSHLYYRPLQYFIVVMITAGSIIFSIIKCSSGTVSITTILLKIIILAGSIYAGKYFEFYGVYGVDPWWHNVAIQQTIYQGHITGGYLFESYYYEFPLFHILGSVTQVVSELPVYTSVFVSIGFSLCVSCLFIFLICKKIFDIKTSLLATLIIPLSAYTIQMSSAIIPMSLGYFFFLVIVYLLLYRDRGKAQNSLLFILMSSALILTHPVASLITLLTLIAFYIGFKIFKFLGKESARQQTVSVFLVILFGAAMLGRWMQVAPLGQSFFGMMFSNFSQSLDTGVQTAIGGGIVSSGIPYIIQNLNQGAYLILLAFGLVGALICLHSRNRTPVRLAMVITLLILTGLPYGFQFLNLQTILPERWFLFSDVPLSVLAILALVSLCGTLKNNLRMLTIFLVGIVVIFLSITNSVADDDSPLIYNGSQRIGYTKSEVTAVETLTNVETGIPETDLYYGISWPRIIEHYRVTAPGRSDNNTQNDTLTVNRDIFVQRNYYLTHPQWNKEYIQGLLRTDADNKDVDKNVTGKVNFVQYMKQQGDQIYSNGNVTVYSVKMSNR